MCANEASNLGEPMTSLPRCKVCNSLLDNYGRCRNDACDRYLDLQGEDRTQSLNKKHVVPGKKKGKADVRS